MTPVQATQEKNNLEAERAKISLASAPETLGGQFLLGIGTGLGGNLVTAGLNTVVGWAANQMGLNYGTSGQLEEINEQLTLLTELIESAIDNYQDQTLLDKITTVNQLFSPVQSANTQLQTELQNTQITNAPMTPPVSFSDLVDAIKSIDFPTLLNNANLDLTGPGALIMYAQQLLCEQVLGIDRPDNMQNFPWRNNHIFDKLMPLYKHFAAYQNMALNLYAEQAHNYLLNPDPVIGVANLAPNFNSAVENLKAQRQQLPLYMSQWGIIVDYENGIMWWETMQDADTYDNAKNFADNFSVTLDLPDGSQVTYDDWRLPTYGECVTLQNRGKYCPTPDLSVPHNSDDDYPDTGQATAGLPSLGFYSVADALNTAPNDNGKNGDMWMSYYSYNPLSIPTWSLFGKYEFRLNHANNNTSYENKDDDTNVYLICRTFGPRVLTNPAANDSNWPTTMPSAVEGKNFTAGEYAQYGIPTAISVSTTSAPSSITFPDETGEPKSFPVPANSVQAVAHIDYTINLGGNYTMGHSSTESFSTSAYSETGTVSTTDNTNGNHNKLRDLVNWSSSDIHQTIMLNLPYVSGVAVPRSTQAVTLSASLLGAGGQVVQGDLEFTPSEISPHTLVSIQISPRNQIYGSTNAQPSQGQYPYYCTGFYADGSMETLGTEVTWDIPDNPANASMVVNADGVSLSLNQPGETNPSPYDLTITASYQGVTDSTTIQIVPPTGVS